MVFDSRFFSETPGQRLSQDRFREVEVNVSFRNVTCYQCGLQAIYKYRVLQVRRKPAIECSEEEEIRPEHEAIWKAIPRFAEIPQTVKCKRCGEVLGLYTTCIF